MTQNTYEPVLLQETTVYTWLKSPSQRRALYAETAWLL
jgi:hypothetical protein